MAKARVQRITITPELLDAGQFRNQQNLAAVQKWIDETPPVILPTVAELVSYQTDPGSQMRALEEALGLTDAQSVQSSIEQILFAAQASSPVQLPRVVSGGGRVQGPEDPRETGMRFAIPENIVTAVEAGFESMVTGAQFLEMIKTGNYPSWWGPIHGLADVSLMLSVELRAFRMSWLPQVTKDLAAENISKAMTYVREQRARAGEQIPF